MRIDRPAFPGCRVLADFPLARLVDYIDWSPFFLAWELKGKYPGDPRRSRRSGAAARELYDDARRLLDDIIRHRWLTRQRRLRLLARGGRRATTSWFTPTRRRQQELTRFHTLRQQWERKGQDYFRALADYVAPLDSGRAGLPRRVRRHGRLRRGRVVRRFDAEHDDYNAIMVKALADRLAEAFAECLHAASPPRLGLRRRGIVCRTDDLIAERYRGIRPAPGYPAQPDHTEKRILFDLLQAETQRGVTLTENYAMLPAASVCGLYFAHPEARYFAVDRITRDQVEDYARRKGMTARRSRTLAGAEPWLRIVAIGPPLHLATLRSRSPTRKGLLRNERLPRDPPRHITGQIYTALIYEGPGIVKHIKRGLCELLARDGVKHVNEAIGTEA